MQPKNPEYRKCVDEILEKAAFIQDVGIYLVDLTPGKCVTGLVVAPRHLQQDGVVHAGVLATMADHTSGAACGSLIAAHEYVLTVEFKINILRAVPAKKLVCEAQVLRPGSRLSVSESSIYAESNDAKERKLVAKAMVTLAVLRDGQK